MQLGPRGKRIYFLIVSMVFGGAIVAVSVINGRGPLAQQEDMLRPPFSASTAVYFQRSVFRPSKMLFSDTLHYYIAPPRTAGRAGQLYPLVLVLHDDAGAAPAARYLLHPRLAVFYPAFVVVPQIPEHENWAVAGGAKVRFGADALSRADMALALVQDLIEKIPVDPTRVYVIGCGDGGTGVFRAVKTFPELVTAGIAMSGRWPVAEAAHLAKTPIWILHGQYDTHTPAYYMQNLSTHIRSAGGDVRFTAIPKMRRDCHDPRLYMNAIWSWLFAHQRADQLPPQSVPSVQ